MRARVLRHSPKNERPLKAGRACAPLVRAWLCLTLLLLLSFQGLGQVHRLVHGGSPPARLQLQAGAVALTTGAPRGEAEAWGHQSGDRVCQLLDQFSHDLLMPALPLAACAPLPQPQLAELQPLDAAAAVHWKRGARGPPRST